MADETRKAEGEDAQAQPGPATLATSAEKADEVKKPEDLVGLAQTPETSRKLAELNTDLKVPTDLKKVSDAKARELVEAGIVEDADLPGKMYKRKADGFVTRIPNYTFNAYSDYHKDEWDEIKLASSDKSE